MDLLSPRKKRRTLESADDTGTFTTPKKLRADLLVRHSSTNPKSPSKHALATSLPLHLSRLLSIQTSLQHALSVALATSAVAPCTDTGRVPNVLTHLSLTSSMGFKVSCSVDDIKRLCWLWEWDGVTAGDENNKTRTRRQPQVQVQVVEADEEDNPFIDDSFSFVESKEDNTTDWIRGSMGFVITPTTHFVKTEGRRVPAYGIGIEVEIDLLAEGMGGGMSSVARWTGDGETRKKELERKLKSWVEIHEKKESNIPPIPLASLPPFPTNSSPTKLSSLTALLKSKSKTPTPLSTHKLSSPSPQKPITLARTPSSARRTVPKFIFPTPPSKNSLPFPSTPRTPIESPTKYNRIHSSSITTPSVITPRNQPRSGPGPEPEPEHKHKPEHEPGSRSSSPTKSAGLSLLSRSLANASSIPGKTDSSSPPPKANSLPFPPQTPSTSGRTGIQPETPGSSTSTSATPRRAALLERIRLKSLSSDDLDSSISTPSKARAGEGSSNSSMTKEQLKLLGQEEMRRRVLLGRLDEVAATIWAAFSSPSQTLSTSLSVARKRRTMRFDEIVRAVVTSARVPISSADAQDSVVLLMNLCPFFLKPLIIDGEEWVEMPASNPNNPTTPPSPRRKNVSEEEVRNRSPKSVRMEAKGGLRDVRERIRREIEECSI